MRILAVTLSQKLVWKKKQKTKQQLIKTTRKKKSHLSNLIQIHKCLNKFRVTNKPAQLNLLKKNLKMNKSNKAAVSKKFNKILLPRRMK